MATRTKRVNNGLVTELISNFMITSQSSHVYYVDSGSKILTFDRSRDCGGQKDSVKEKEISGPSTARKRLDS